MLSLGNIDICHFCVSAKAEVDIEVINLSEEDIVAWPACRCCANFLVARTYTPIEMDLDNLAFATIGVIGGAPEEVN